MLPHSNTHGTTQKVRAIFRFARCSYDFLCPFFLVDFVVEPSTGTLAPGANVLLRATFVAGRTSELFDMDVVCSIHNETLAEKIAEKEEEDRRRMEEFALDEDEEILEVHPETIRYICTYKCVKTAHHAQLSHTYSLFAATNVFLYC